MSLRAIVLGCALVAAAAAGIACNDDGGGPATYFVDLERIDREATARSQATDARLRELLEDLGQADESTRDAVVADFRELLAIFSDFIDEMEGLEPPQVAVVAHDEAVEAFREVEEQLGAFLDDVAAAAPEDVEEMIRGESPPDLQAANGRATIACEQLEFIAGLRDIQITLNCGGP
jgi:hypothetical protein